MPRAKQRTPELRARVLAEAVRALAKDGAAGFTTRKVAERADTSTPAVYELFGDRAGLVREMFFEGFRRLGAVLESLEESADPLEDLVRFGHAFRGFILDNPDLSQLMFSRRFAEFDPGPSELAAGNAVRAWIVARVKRAISAGKIAGDATDIAHVLVSTVQGLAATELAGWLGSSKASRERRWTLALCSLLRGLG
jgi:AcrR family transcriptional regulator